MKKLFKILSVLIMVFALVMPIKTSAATMSSKAGIVATESDNLNVRKTASTKGTILTSLKKGSYITLISKSGDWWYVEYSKGKYGYCHLDYIKTKSGTAKRVNLSSGTLNVRSKAGTSQKIVGSLSNNQIVIVLSESDGWSRVLYDGTKTGFVSSKYLSSSSVKTVKLSVPSFKQTDSRWANVKIGSSGKTISQIGCATTAIAMVESYRQGKTITPDVMSKRLKYTSSGSVYWPSHYTVVTSSSGYISKIKSKIDSKKPILFGAKNKYGAQHWVVVIGYTGSGNKTSDFLINDPGSNKRTTLAQFLSAYPTFYKYFSY